MVLIQPILDRVKNGTEADLIALAQEFDGVTPASIRVRQSELDKALSELAPAIRSALELSITRVKKVHNDQVRTDKTTTVVDGGTVTEKWVPVDRVGLYVPGGRAVYPSSVMMNVIPAQIAKVKSIAVASPPQIEFGGMPHPTILATCALLGITEVYAVGGAQAIALFAYGMDDVCEKADLVTGPGNIYVADQGNRKIRKVTPAGVVTTLAGSGSAGSSDGGGPIASFNAISSMALDSSGNIYAADYQNYNIRKVTSAGVVTTLAGSGSSGPSDGPGYEAKFGPMGLIKIDGSGNVYVSDNYKIRKITPQ
jgi:hypothetical protein